MRKIFPEFIFLVSLFLVTTAIQAQTVNFQDGFDDGNFTADPVWSGDTSQYNVIEKTIDGQSNHLLQLNGNSTKRHKPYVSYLSTPSTKVEGYWEFYIALGFAPSGGNYADIFLMSDSADLTGDVSGYAVQAGEAKSRDVFRIVRFDSGTKASTPVLSDTTDIHSGGKFRVRVTRQSGGTWKIQVGKGYSGKLFEAPETAMDNTHKTANYFGVRSTYSSTRAKKFTYDFKIKLSPFKINNVSASGDSIDVTFNQPIDQSTAQPRDFTVNNGLVSPVSVTFPSPNVAQLHYNNTLPSDKYTLQVQNIKDQSGTSIGNHVTASFIIFDNYSSGDIIINEFMYDPPGGQKEYVELKNQSNKYLNLQGWKIDDNTVSHITTISTNPVILQPHSFLVLSKDTTSLFNVYGSRPYLQVSNLPSLNNGGDAVKLLTDNKHLVDSLSYTPSWGGSKIALERKSDDLSAVYKENWGDSPNSLGGTPGLPNEVAKDKTPPSLTSLIFTDDQTLLLNFSEGLKNAQAVDVQNYSLDHGIAVKKAIQTAADSIRLKLSKPMNSGTQYHLSITGQQDIFGNRASKLDTTYLYYEISQADSGDVIINEFMYDPPEGQSEYVELKNQSNKYLNLQGWKIDDNTVSHTGSLSNDRIILQPDSFLVLSKDTSSLFHIYGSRHYIQVANWPSLNNGGDAIELMTDSGKLVDSLSYTSNWGGTKVSLERRSAAVSAIYKENWDDSPNPLGGTPGLPNDVAKDKTPTSLQSLMITDNQTLLLTFSERLKNAPAADIQNYTLDHGISVKKAIRTDADSIQLKLSKPMDNGIQYHLSITNQQDIFGNTAAQIDTSFSYYKVSRPSKGDIFINEFMYDPPEGQTEYVELYNPTSKSFNLQGWEISDNTGNYKTITGRRLIVPPDSFVVLAPDRTLLSDYQDIILVPLGSHWRTLNNSGDAIVIRDSAGTLLDSLSYNSGWGGSKVALERRTTNAGSFEANFGDASNGFGSPGSANQISPDTTPPKLTSFSVLDNQSLEFVFSEGLQKKPAVNSNNYQLKHGLKVTSASLLGRDTVHINLSGKLHNNTTYTATINGIKDLFGNTLAHKDTTFTYFIVSKPDSGDIFINEFMYDPPEGQTEYVELYNRTSQSFNLQGWEISDNTGNYKTITGRRLIVPPDSFVVLAPDRTLLSDYPDIILAALGSHWRTLNNSDDAIVIRDSAEALLDSLSYNSGWGGSGQALERRSIKVPPTEANFGEDKNGFGSPGSPNSVPPDKTPPVLGKMQIRGSQSIQLIFSEALNKKPALRKKNYSLSKGEGIDGISFSAPDTIRLKLSKPMKNGTTYKLTIRNQQDLFGNMAAKIDTSLSYYKIAQPSKGDIFINEFMYDPPEGQTEYVELYNPTSKSFNLQGWEISDNTGNYKTITDRRLIIPPDSFVVLAPDRTLLSDYPDIILATLGNHWRTLNNSGDAIVVRDSAGTLLDSLNYNSGWGGSRVALERRTTNAGSFEANFGDSPNGFGTPGAPNQILPDRTPPKLTGMHIIDNTTIQLLFSEPIQGKTATNSSNYSIKPAKKIHLIAAIQDTVTLYLSDQLESGQGYIVTIHNLQDIFGNTISAPVSKKATFIKYSGAKRGDVIINEILHSGDPQFVELYNPTDHNYDISGWKINDSKTAASIDAGIHLLSGGYVVLTDNKRLASKVNHAIYISNLPHYNKKSDAVYLQDKNGKIIDSLAYSPSFANPDGGKSMERIDPGAASNDPSNFATSTAVSGSTPGKRNSVYEKDTTPPALQFAEVLPDSRIRARFSEFIKLRKDTHFHINHQSLSVGHFDAHQANTIILQSKNSLPKNKKLTLKATKLEDVSGNKSKSSSVPVTRPAKSGNVVINEIMYAPVKDPDDNIPDQGQYIELRNIAKYAVSLKDVSLHDAPDENGDVRSIYFVTTQSKYIPPDQTALIYSDTARSFSKSRVAVFFHLSEKPQTSLLRADRKTLSLTSTSDAIYLAGKTGKTIDSVYYNDSWQNPNLAATKGLSLERINPKGPSNNSSNWGTSTAELGGTPDQENTLYQVPEQNKKQKVGIRLTPNPFSPDGDGHDDRLFINYKLDGSNYLITVDIYDRYGRKVRELVNDKPAGLQGSLIWDGLKDNGSRNRIGFYIIIFKAHDSSNGHSKAFKKTVVLARRLH
jgi:hypothetical protein